MIKKISITAISVLLAASVRGQGMTYGAVDNFFMANPDLPDLSQYAGRLVNPHYILVNWNAQQTMDERMTSNGFVRLGVSSWVSHDPYGGGIPQREIAIEYARSILGADIVVYATKTETEGDDYNPYGLAFDHNVWFYAKAGGYTARHVIPDYRLSELQEAEAHLQAAWDRLPTWRKNQLRPMQRAWIVTKDAAPIDRRIQMIYQRTAWLLRQY